MSNKIARFLLDLGTDWSVCGVAIMGSTMDRATTEPAIVTCLIEIETRLGEAARIAKAATACARAGSISEAVTVSMDIEQLIYEAGGLHSAASLLNRLAQT